MDYDLAVAATGWCYLGYLEYNASKYSDRYFDYQLDCSVFIKLYDQTF